MTNLSLQGVVLAPVATCDSFTSTDGTVEVMCGQAAQELLLVGRSFDGLGNYER